MPSDTHVSRACEDSASGIEPGSQPFTGLQVRLLGQQRGPPRLPTSVEEQEMFWKEWNESAMT
jgi:hypothetical protein